MTDISRLPGPVIEKWDWQLRGACRGLDVERFFHPDGERGPRRSSREAQAKAVCARCPVLEACREHALASREPFGIWGGMSEHEREVETARRAADPARRPGEPARRPLPLVEPLPASA